MVRDQVRFSTALEFLQNESGYQYKPEQWVLTRADITLCTQDEEWQIFRRELKGQTTRQKLQALARWYGRPWDVDRKYESWVQVTNYLNALKRGGLLI